MRISDLPENPALFSKEEHRNLVALERNLKLTEDFLFHGTKEIVNPIGEEEKPEVYDILVGAKQIKARVAQEEAEREAERRVEIENGGPLGGEVLNITDQS